MKNINKTVLATTLILSLMMTGCSESDGSSSSSVNNPEPKPVVNPYKSAGWYGKTQVSIDVNGKVYNHDTAGVFGELVQSSEGKDLHDIPGYGDATFQVVFPQTGWGDDSGDYFSNYQNYTEGSNDKKVWTFQLKAALASSFPVTINLDGLFDIKYKDENGKVEYKESKEVNKTLLNALHLVDVDNAAEYTVAELATANLTMAGPDGELKTRTFRWVLGSVDTTDYEPLSAPQRSAALNQSTTSEPEETPKKVGKFGLPPQ